MDLFKHLLLGELKDDEVGRAHHGVEVVCADPVQGSTKSWGAWRFSKSVPDSIVESMVDFVCKVVWSALQASMSVGILTFGEVVKIAPLCPAQVWMRAILVGTRSRTNSIRFSVVLLARIYNPEPVLKNHKNLVSQVGRDTVCYEKKERKI